MTDEEYREAYEEECNFVTFYLAPVDPSTISDPVERMLIDEHQKECERWGGEFTNFGAGGSRKISGKIAEAPCPAEMIHAVDLASHTGLREGDLARVSWSHVGEDAIMLASGKSGGRREAIIPLYDELRNVLARIPKRSTTIVAVGLGNRIALPAPSSEQRQAQE